MQAKGGNEGGEQRQEWKQAHAGGVGCRDEWCNLAGGGCRQLPGGRRTALGEEVGSECDIEIL